MEEAAGSTRFSRRRPHEEIRDLEPKMGLLVLLKMNANHTGNPHGDAYVQYHLMPVVNEMIQQHVEARLFGDAEVEPMPELVANQLEKLLRDAPLERMKSVRIEHKRTPPELWKEYYELRRSTRLTVGTPPFQRTVRLKDAERMATGARKREISQALQRIEQIRPQLKSERDTEGHWFNGRVRNFNRVSRRYMGDLLESLVASGSDQTFDLFANTIQSLLDNNNQSIAYDLLDVFYGSIFKGYLRLYDRDQIDRLQRRIEGMANRHRNFADVHSGEEKLQFRADGQRMDVRRSFYDASFHLREMLREPEILSQFVIQNRGKLSADPLPESDRVRSGVTADTLDHEHVSAAIRRAINGINRRYPSTRRGIHPHLGMGTDRFHRVRRHSASRYETGYNALASWALLAAGESSQDPRLFERINVVLRGDPRRTFERGMRLQSLRYLPRERYRPWLARDAQWLIGAMIKQPPLIGAFPTVFTDENKQPGDNVQAFYGVLGMSAAQESGYSVGRNVWQSIDYHWRATQQSTPDDQPAGWARGFYNLDRDVYDNLDKRTKNRLTARGGPDPFVTAAGCYALDVAQRNLGRPQDRNSYKAPPGSAGNELQKGLAWLDRNFSMGGDPAEFEFYYRMWLMQRLGMATGRRAFNDIDWVRDITTEIIHRQEDDGLWSDTEFRGYDSIPPIVPTGMSLLYLSGALHSAAVSKVNLGNGAWNERPSDLRNFVEYASDLYEVQTGWQIIEPDAKLVELQDSPLLLLTTGEPFELTDAEIERLREYVDAGGLIVTNAEKGRAEQRSFRTSTPSSSPTSPPSAAARPRSRKPPPTTPSSSSTSASADCQRSARRERRPHRRRPLRP